MNLQHDKFAYRYALYGGQKGDGAKAGRDAGFKDPHAATRLLKNPKIRERVEYYKKKIKEEIEMQPKEIIARLQKIARREEPYEKASAKDSREALKDLGKYHSMPGFAEKVIIEQKVPFEDWSLEELRELKRTGKVPRGKKVPDIRAVGGFISGILSEKSGTGNN